MTGPADQVLQGLLDREAIRDLPARYCHYVWTNDVEAMVSLFTDDGLLSTTNADGSVRETRGAAALRRFYASLDSFKPRPYIHNHVFALQDGGRAAGACYVELRSAVSDMNFLGTGWYDDTYVKIGGLWKFEARRYHAVKMVS